ncbi:MAG: hypothetical protein ACI88A_004458 [Paraglaciecola sp.]|jgi:hypothetical protein
MIFQCVNDSMPPFFLARLYFVTWYGFLLFHLCGTLARGISPREQRAESDRASTADRCRLFRRSGADRAQYFRSACLNVITSNVHY